jgi:hypothetical protein
MRRAGSVVIATSYGLDGPGSIPGRVKRIFPSLVSRPNRKLTQPLLQSVPGVLSQGLKRPGREADYSRASSAEVKNAVTIPPLPQTC